MEDKDLNEDDIIDEFTIALPLSGANNVTHTGNEQLATIALSYQIHCMNLSDCPTPSLSPTSKYIVWNSHCCVSIQKCWLSMFTYLTLSFSYSFLFPTPPRFMQLRKKEWERGKEKREKERKRKKEREIERKKRQKDRERKREREKVREVNRYTNRKTDRQTDSD